MTHVQYVMRFAKERVADMLKELAYDVIVHTMKLLMHVTAVV